MNGLPSDVRKWHYLRPNHRCSIPSNLLFVDTETCELPIDSQPESNLQTLKLWCATSCRMRNGKPTAMQRYQGTTSNQFWQLVDSLINTRNPLWIFAHNAGFDMTTLCFWDLLEHGTYLLHSDVMGRPVAPDRKAKGDWTGLAVIDDPPTIIKCRRASTSCIVHIVDTFNYFRCSAKELGDMLDVPKLSMPGQAASNEEWFRYCSRDVEIIYRAITGLMSFVREHDLGNWGYTLPSQAFAAFRHRFMHHKILIHGNKETLELERDAYYGGRCQIFYQGKVGNDTIDTLQYFNQAPPFVYSTLPGPVYVCDIQSCYPGVMLHNEFPVKLINTDDKLTLDDVRLHGDNVLCIVAKVQMDTTEDYPVRVDNITHMATGKLTTTLCGPELYYAIKRGHVIKILSAAFYNGAYIFDSYVDYFWKLRKAFESQDNTVYADMCKLFLNSLFGKFGQRAKQWENAPDVASPMPWGTWATWDSLKQTARQYRSIAWLTQIESTAGESMNSSPAISAYVTSYARELVRRYLSIAKKENCYYIDTDSLHVNEQGYRLLLASGSVKLGELGFLRLVGTYDTAEYRGLKDYTLGDTEVIAGIRQSATKTGQRTYSQIQFQRLRSILASDPPPGVTTSTVTVDRSRNGIRGSISSDGRITSPRYEMW